MADITKRPTVPQCAGGGREGHRGERSFPRPPEAAKRLEPERLAEPISPAEHRRTEGGSVRRRRVSEASLEPERLAKPISPAEHRRTEGGSVRSKGRAKLPPPIGELERKKGTPDWALPGGVGICRKRVSICRRCRKECKIGRAHV